jgi:hypothetical protein
MSNNQQSKSCKAPSPLRVVAAGVVAVVLLGSSWSAVRGASLAGYAGNGDDDDSGISGGAIAGIVIGGGAATYFIANAIEKEKEKKKEEGGSSSSRAASPKVESVRVMPQNVHLERGAAQDFQIQVRYAGEKTWQTVTDNSAASLKVMDTSGRVVALDGAKNVFTAPIDAKGGPASLKVVGSFAGAQATSTVAVQ